MNPDDVVVLEGGSRDGQTVSFRAMERVASGVFELDTGDGVYRHSEESVSDFRDGQARATFEPSVAGEA